MVGKGHEYKAMSDCERSLWWYRSLHTLTLRKIKQYCLTLDPDVLDAGCGTGGMLGILKKKGYKNITGFDLSSDAINYSKSIFHFDVRQLDIIECDKCYDAQSFDVIIINDVLCLLSDNKAKLALYKLTSLLKPGGCIYMNLPAGAAFKGTHDIAVGILKRYSPADVRELASGIITINEYLFWPFLLSPVIFGIRFFQRIKMFFKDSSHTLSDVALPPAGINKFLGFITNWENIAIDKKPWGSSIFVVMQKTF